MSKIGVIDYGSGNIYSLVKAFERVGGQVNLISSPDQISNADKFVLPGVGAFGSVMQKLESTGFKEALTCLVEQKRPLLGICVGMQVLFDVSYEFGEQEGLGIIRGKVEQLPAFDVSGVSNRIPHIGWSEVFHEVDEKICNSGNGLFKLINDRESFYFVHSFSAKPSEENISVTYTIFEGHSITAAVRKDMVFGTQFHPEKSGVAGLQLLENYANL